MQAQNLRSVVANNIYLVRTLNKWSQRELGDLTGTSQSSISDWERGLFDPPLDAIAAIAAKAGLEPHEMFIDLAERIVPRRSA